jgi:predicted MFS family arabinose efflux permease
MTDKASASFRSLAWSNLAAQSAEQIALASVPLIAVLDLGAGVGETGLLAAAQTLPFLLLSFPAGILADRTSRKWLMIAAEGARAIGLLLFPMFAAFGLLSVPLLAVLGFLTTTGTVAFSVAAPALVPALVPRDRLARANGVLELARSAAFAAGPALGGILIGWLGASASFTTAAILSLMATVFLLRLREPARKPRPPQHVLKALREGARFAWNDPHLRPILLTAVAWNLAWTILQAAYTPYAAEIIGLSASGIGATLASFGVGMIVGAAIAPRVMAFLPLGMTIVVGPLVSVIAAAIMAATVWLPSPLLAGLSFFLFGAGPLVWTVSTTTLRQAVTPETLIGRVSALYVTANTGARPVGALLAGLIGTFYGPTACIVVATLAFAVQLLLILFSPVPAMARLAEAA